MCSIYDGNMYLNDVKKILKKSNELEKKENRLNLYSYPENSFEYHITLYFEKKISSFVSKEYGKKSLRRPFVCKLFWVDNERIDAKVKRSNKYDDTYYVLLYKGLITKLRQRLKSKILIKSAPDFSTNVVNEMLGVTSVDSSLNQVELTILCIIYIYIINHEVGHILCGHQKDPRKFCGYKDQNKELCADCIGFYAALDSVESSNSPFLLKTLSVASFLFWLIKEEDIKDNMFVEEISDHPHPNTRYLYMASWLIQDVKSSDCKLEPEVKEDIIKNALDFFRVLDDRKKCFDNQLGKTCDDEKEIGSVERDEVDKITDEYEFIFDYYKDDAYYDKDLLSKIIRGS